MSLIHTSDRYDSYKIDFLIGKGGTGKVYSVTVVKEYTSEKVNHKFNIGENYAIKIFPLHCGSANTIDEIKLLSNLDHPNIIKIYDVFLTRNFGEIEVCIVMEKLRYSIYEIIECSIASQFSPESKIKIAYEIIKGVDYLHRSNIIHGDIKPRNILIQVDNGEIKIRIIDFGFSSNLFHGYEIHDISGTIGYTAPEVLKDRIHKGCFDSFSNSQGEDVRVLKGLEADIWSLGATILSIFVPYVHGKLSSMDLLQKSFEFDLKIAETDWSSDPNFRGSLCEVPDILSKMIQLDPAKRWSTKQLLDHTLFESLKKQEPTDLVTNKPDQSLNYLRGKSEISTESRNFVVEWIREVLLEFKCGYLEIFVSIDLFDRYLYLSHLKYSNTIPGGYRKDERKLQYQLFAMISMYLSLYIVPTELGPSRLRDFLYVSKFTYTKDQAKEAINEMLTGLNWRLYNPQVQIERDSYKDDELLFKKYLHNEIKSSDD